MMTSLTISTFWHYGMLALSFVSDARVHHIHHWLWHCQSCALYSGSILSVDFSHLVGTLSACKDVWICSFHQTNTNTEPHFRKKDCCIIWKWRCSFSILLPSDSSSSSVLGLLLSLGTGRLFSTLRALVAALWRAACRVGPSPMNSRWPTFSRT